MAKKLSIKQVRSTIGRLENHKRTIRALGLGKIDKSVIHENNSAIRGMVRTVQHLVSVKEVDGE